jgi:hypothetical protein
VAGREDGRGAARRALLLLLALACGLGLVVLPAAATRQAADPVVIVIDESVSSADGPTASGPAAVAGDEPVGTADAVNVAPPAGVPGAESVTVGDAVSVVPPAGAFGAEPVSVGDAVTVTPGAGVAAAENAVVTDEVILAVVASPTTTTLTVGPDPALAGTPVLLQATVAAGQVAVNSGAVTFEEDGRPLGPPVPVDATGRASLSVSDLSFGVHKITGDFGGAPKWIASRGVVGEGVYGFSLRSVPDQTASPGDRVTYGLTLALDPGSVTYGLPATVALAAGPLPVDASSDAPATIPFPQSPGSPATLNVTVQTGLLTLGDIPLLFTAGARSAGSGLHLYDYSLALAPATLTVERGDTASFLLTSSLALGSSTIGLPAALSLTTSSGAVAGTLALPGSTTVTVATDSSTPAGAQTVTVAADRGHRTASASLFVNVAPHVSAGGPYAANEGATVALHGSATGGGALTYGWDLGGGLTATGTDPVIVAPDGPASRSVRLTVCDDHGGCASDTTTLTIANVAPAVTVSAPADGSVFRVGAAVPLTGSFTDPGVLDTHTAVWTVGGTTIPASVAEHDGAGTASATWTPAAAGLYRFSLAVTDKDGATTRVAGGTLVVFDPAAGFVTGQGALFDGDRRLVLFALDARYRGGASNPSGRVELVVPRLNVVSTRLDWLVVTGSSFELEGVGRSGARAGYRFRLNGVAGRPDRLRVRVWAPDGTVAYDSTLRPLLLGDIAIHH